MEVKTTKNRYSGLITVEFSDGYVERCLIWQHIDKGAQQFMSDVVEFAKIILAAAPTGKVKLKYRGDFFDKLASSFEEVIRDDERKAKLAKPEGKLPA